MRAASGSFRAPEAASWAMSRAYFSEASRSAWKAPSIGRSAGIVWVASQVPLT